ALDIAVLGPALPAMRETFGVDARTGSWLFNAFVFANFVGVPLMATLSDRLGRRPVFMLDVALFGLGALLVGTMSTFEGVLVGRVMQGLAASGVFPAAAAVSIERH
ncbi:MAG: MFS transporter, partial [Bacteroidetes bacterium]|nr:MFS transporter [Bacteroidota bacterium]